MLSTFITVCNVFLKKFSYFLGEYSRFERRTQYNIEVAKGIAISQFINSAIIPFMLEVLIFSGNYTGKLFGSGGLVYN